ncbi:hypothetical protein TEA_004362 [Camellia sinensis var. sinensis]|uniref:Laccase n=1 Tax=Camellia sinensis var. sinensis TaxID=542762 RepID=A0A4S4D981_CAMSN|nr:hypothetical protein TEA_004362 [Camellia sinensis var. sinensis]
MFQIQVKNVSRLCNAKPIVTVNGMFPGPSIYVREGDQVLVNVTNHAQYNMSIHWHDLKQFRNGWADGPAYITQCPIKNGHSYIYNFTVTDQRGTLWWHAHILWLRATVYGAIVIMPKEGTPFPFPQPHRETNIILGEWWNQDVETIVTQANKLGLPPQPSNAHTINGKPGPLFPRSEKHTFAMEVEFGKTYLLRIINAALNDEHFFAIAGHSMTVVEIDAVYTKPFTTKAILIVPGQTTNVLVKADQSPKRYFMAARPFMDAPITVDNKPVTAILQYEGIPNSVLPILPQLPVSNDTKFAMSYNSKLKSLNSPRFPAKVPLQIDRHLFYTIGLGINPCPTCQKGTQVVASLNNITFVMPKIGLLQAHYFDVSGVFRTDFPDKPLAPFNYTGAPLTANLGTAMGTGSVSCLSILQLNWSYKTLIFSAESHPFRLHGFNFFVVGSGIGNFDPKKDPAKFNLVDPPERNTVGVPTGGWTAIRFRADNPGVWFMHCHLELHTTWGLKMAFVVKNGKSAEESVLPPPKDLPPC